jgi:hypothetical protein
MREAEPVEWQAANAPREMPTTYPGLWPTTSILLAGDRHFRLQLRLGRRLGQARVMSGQGLTGDETRPSDPPLNYALVRYNVAPVDDRVPVLAVGSNASPAQLRHKFANSGVSLVMPLVRATVEGLAAGVAADVAPTGYVPATPIVGPDLVDVLFVQWLDGNQLALLDETEHSYDRVLLPAGDPTDGGVRVTLSSGETLGACYAYVSTRGALAMPNGAKAPESASDPGSDDPELRRIPRGGPPLLDGRPGADRQSALLSALLSGSPRLRQLMGDCATWFERIVEPGTADALRQAFQDEGWVRQQDALRHLYDAQAAGRDPGPVRLVYRRILPAGPPPDGQWRVVPSSDAIDRRGQGVVRLTPAASEALGRPEHVAVQPAGASLPGSDREGLETIALVLESDEAAAPYATAQAAPATPAVGQDEGLTPHDRLVEMDEILRLGLGVEVGEEVTLTPIQVHHRRWLDHLIGRPFYVTCRVQAGDTATAERDVCLLEPLTLDLLGLQSGAEVVIEGRADGEGEATQIRVKAVAASDAVCERREGMHGGDFSSRFPSARDALGTASDLPWIFIDSSERSLLGLGGQRLATVRVRASRSFQLRQEMREMLLVLGIAFIGIIEIVTETWARVGALLVMVGIIVAAISVRMRGRLTRRMVRPSRQRRRT